MSDTTPAPNTATVLAYLGSDTSWGVTDRDAALAAETRAQAHACRVPAVGAPWPADLAEALHRRVARNLAMRGLPLGLNTVVTEAGAAVTRIGTDPEIRRLEAPYRKVTPG